jgi:hypothetical protein
MIPPLDPFSAKFDSIEIEGAPSSAAYDHAMALAAPTAAAPELEPGFYLLSDANGRFVVDRAIGVISVKDDALVEIERGQVHSVRLRVVEPSGAVYELDLRLRITGRVPQMVSEEDFPLGGDVTPARAPELAPLTRIGFAPPRPTVPWSTFSAFKGAGAPGPLSHCGGAAYGALLDVRLPAVSVSFASLVLVETLPAPSGRNAIWTI